MVIHIYYFKQKGFFCIKLSNKIKLNFEIKKIFDKYLSAKHTLHKNTNGYYNEISLLILNFSKIKQTDIKRDKKYRNAYFSFDKNHKLL